MQEMSPELRSILEALPPYAGNEAAAPITARVPDPASAPDAARRDSMQRALAYMDLRPGMPLADMRSTEFSSAPVPTAASKIFAPPQRCSMDAARSFPQWLCRALGW